MSRWRACVLLGMMQLACGGDAPAPPMLRPRARVGSRGNFVGTFQPATATWTLCLSRPGWSEPESERSFVFGAPHDVPVVGDWDGDGQQTPGTFRDGLWTLSNAIDGAPLPAFRFGKRGHLPIVGDWDGDGVATVGLYYDGVFSLRNSNSEGMADHYVELGSSDDLPVVGDWDGDGTDTVGIYTPSTGDFTLLDANDTHAGDTLVELGVTMASPVVGDWDDNRRDTVGVVVGADWTLLNDHRPWKKRDHSPIPELAGKPYQLSAVSLSFGESDAIPVTGNWLPNANRGYADVGPALREFFPLAADYQLPESFETWVDAGVNTVIRVRSANDPLPADAAEIEAWTNQANQLSLKMIREPRANLTADAAEPNLLAFMLQDEPELREVDPSVLASQADAVRAATSRPVFNNFAGWPVLLPSAPSGPGDGTPVDTYARYVAAQDWVAQDLYAISQMYEHVQLNVNDALATLPLTFNKLRRWAPTKPQFAYIETSQHNGPERVLSPQEFRAQVWLAIAGGVRGIFYFAANDCGHPQCMEPDGTEPDVRDEMRKQNARITALTHVLQGEINPPSFSVSAPAPLELAWRASEDGNYIIAVNPTTRARTRWIRLEGITAGDVEVLDENRRIETHEGYAFRDTIPALDARVYRFR